jgi:hypothetical protein
MTRLPVKNDSPEPTPAEMLERIEALEALVADLRAVVKTHDGRFAATQAELDLLAGHVTSRL